MISKINLDNKLKEIEKSWSPIEVARINEYVIRMALFKGNITGTSIQMKMSFFMYTRGV